MESGGSSAHPGADAADEIALDALGDCIRAAVGVEARQIESKALGALPQMRDVGPPAVRIERVAEFPERTLNAGRLRRRVQRRRPRMLGRHREVAEAEAQRQLADARPGRRAVGAAEVRVDDRLDPVPREVIVDADRRHRGAGQLAHPSTLSPQTMNNVRLTVPPLAPRAPGYPPGVIRGT